MQYLIKFTTLCLVSFYLFGCTGRKVNGAEESQEAVTEKPPYSVRMSTSDMERNPEGWMIDFNEKPKWDYCHGLMSSAHLAVWKKYGDDQFFDYTKEFADFMINEEGEIKTYKLEEYNIDRVNPGKFLIELYKETGEEKYKKAVDLLRSQMEAHPRTVEGGFWHKKRYEHQMWLDGLYMAAPFLAQYAKEFGDEALYDDVANQIYLIDKYTWDEDKKLFYHGWDESRQQEWANKETGTSPNFWGRSIGWFAMSLVDVLEFFPKDHPKRHEILKVTQKIASSIKMYQDGETGLWYQVMDKGGEEGNYLEASASSMFTYFLVRAVKKGYISQDYLPVAQKGYQGILKEFIREEADGTISITDVCAVAGLGGTPYRDGSYEYYVNEKIRDNDPKAVGPFIMLAVEMEELEKGA